LKEHLKAHPELLGDKVVKKFGEDLPFLFKVRSVPRRRPFALSLTPRRTGARYRQGALDSGSPGQGVGEEAA
jgi:hypothetical protein